MFQGSAVNVLTVKHIHLCPLDITVIMSEKYFYESELAGPAGSHSFWFQVLNYQYLQLFIATQINQIFWGFELLVKEDKQSDYVILCWTFFFFNYLTFYSQKKF